jgi:hypothetical protein
MNISESKFSVKVLFLLRFAVIYQIFSSYFAVFAKKRLNIGKSLEMQRHIHYGSGGSALLTRRRGVKTGEVRGYTPVG